MVDISERIAAIAKFFDVSADDVVEFDSYGLGDSPEFRVKGVAGRYSALSEDEADELWERGLDSYLDDVILDGLSSGVRGYFDRDAWKEDAKSDGRGHCINHYDGGEDEVQLDDGTWMCVYRIG